jgi:hypothetical protein
MTFGITGIVGAEELGDVPERVQNLSDAGGAYGTTQKQELVVQWGEDELGAELRALVDAVNELRPGSWRPAKVAMRINGQDGERVKLRDTLRRSLGSQGERGQEKLAAIPFTQVEPPDAEVVEEPKAQTAATDAPAAAAGTEEPTATKDTPGGLEGAASPDEAQGRKPEDDAEPEQPEVLDGEFVELPPYNRSEHSSLVDRVTELRGILEGMAGDEPTLELEEARSEAQAELDEALAALEAVNRAAEAAGEQRVDA